MEKHVDWAIFFFRRFVEELFKKSDTIVGIGNLHHFQFMVRFLKMKT